MRLELLRAEDEALSISMESDPEIMAHLGGPRPLEAIRDAHRRRVEMNAGGDGAMYKILPDESDEVMGTIGIWPYEAGEEGAYEMGWIVMPAFQGQGIATAAGRMILERARTDQRVTTVWAFPGTDNPASNAICRKLGLENTGEQDIDFSGLKLRCNNWRLHLRGPQTWRAAAKDAEHRDVH